jgi:hypothetical protein
VVLKNRPVLNKSKDYFSDYVRSEQGASIMLEVVEKNQAAHHFWHHLGFELVRKTEPRLFGKKT